MYLELRDVFCNPHLLVDAANQEQEESVPHFEYQTCPSLQVIEAGQDLRL
jgi:hypothetical protein